MMRSFSNMVLIICMLTVGILSSRTVTAVGFMSNPTEIQSSMAPPTQITLEMFELEESGKKTPNRCNNTSTKWGCTAYCGEQFIANPTVKVCAPGSVRPYPFGNNSTITIGIENHLHNGIQQGYLHNVVPSEMNPQNRNAVAVKAQAIAARTYAYFELAYPTCSDNVAAINNSNDDQVYVPYMYHAQPTNGYKTIIDQAVAQRYYMSYKEQINACGTTITPDQPIFSEFSADAYLATIDHPEQNKYPYMQGVPDPISSHPEVPTLAVGSHHRGLSQNGASRWANGNLSSNPTGDKGKWSVRWFAPFQILTHYYTGIQIRDANDGNAIVTPDYRWNALQLDMPTSGCRSVAPWVTVTFQNTGTTNWDFGGSEKLSYSVTYLHPGFPLAAQSVEETVLIPVPSSAASTIPPGGSVRLPFPMDVSKFGSGEGTYRVVFDMVRNGQTFASLATQSGKSWPTEEDMIAMHTCDNQTFLPLSSSKSGTTGEPLQ